MLFIWSVDVFYSSFQFSILQAVVSSDLVIITTLCSSDVWVPKVTTSYDSTKTIMTYQYAILKQCLVGNSPYKKLHQKIIYLVTNIHSSMYLYWKFVCLCCFTRGRRGAVVASYKWNDSAVAQSGFPTSYVSLTYLFHYHEWMVTGSRSCTHHL